MIRRILILALLLLPVLAEAVDTPTFSKSFHYGLRLYLNGRYVNGDSGDVAAAYPAQEDTAGKRQDLTWIGGTIQEWRFTPDSSEVYTIYARASCCSDTSISGLIGRYFQAQDIPEGLIASERAFSSGVIQAALVAAQPLDLTQGDTTGVVEADTLRGVYVEATSELSVQPGASGSSDDLFHADDGEVQVQGVPFVADSAHVQENLLVSGIAYGDTLAPIGTHITILDSLRVQGGVVVRDTLRVGGSLDVDGIADLASITAGGTLNLTSPLGIHQIEGSLTIGNDLIVEDNADVDGRLDVDEHADIADSTQLGSSFGAADSLAAAAVAHGWIAIDGAYLFQHTLVATDASDIIKVPGARSWNTFVFVTSESNTSSTNAANNFAFAEVTGVGEITLLRGGGTTGNATYNILVLKAR